VAVTAALCAAVSAQQPIRIDVTLVNVFATVQGKEGKTLAGLTRNAFRIYEDDLLQEIQVFESEDKVQSAVGLLVDTSGSMADVLPFMREGIVRFTGSLPRSDEFFVVSFGANPRVIHRSSQERQHLSDSLSQLQAYGTSSLFDALLYGSQEIRKSERPRKALIVFTDGILSDDSKTEFPFARVIGDAQRSSVLLYFVVTGPRIIVDFNTIDSLSNISGGRAFYVSKNDAIPRVLSEIRTELSQQYYLGYYPSRKSGLHRIRVEVPGRDVKIRARTGYIGG
jgi:Ca-activated chloride channel homolog